MLDRFSADVGAYLDDDTLRAEIGGLDVEQLRASARELLTALDSLD